MPEKGYEFFEHTADIGLRASGSTLNDLFIHAAQGLVELLVEESPVAARERRSIALQEPSVEALLLRWLKELLFWFHTEGFLPAAHELEVGQTALHGHVTGERFDPARHAQGTEVKGVTYHQFQVRQVNHRWEASVIFDV